MSGDYQAGYGVFVGGKNVLASWIMAESEGTYFRAGCRMKIRAI
jgi:hypothetical protein